MAKLQYVKGDVTKPQSSGPVVIVHVANCWNGFGAGVALAIAKKWPHVKRVYHKLFERSLKDKWCKLLGVNQTIHVTSDDIPQECYVVNMISQDFGNSLVEDCIDYKALFNCLNEAFNFARYMNATIHAPKFGSGLAGGDWNKIESILLQMIEAYGVDCVIYLWEDQ